MPLVPSYDNLTVGAQNLPDARQQTPYRMLQSAELGPGEQIRTGQAMQQAGAEFDREAVAKQIYTNEGKGKEYDANLIGAIQGVLHGTADDPTTGYLAKRGKDAIDGYKDTVKALQDLPSKLADGLDNDAQRQMVKTAAQLRVQTAITQAAEHSSQQAKVYNLAASQTRASVAADSAAAAFNPLTDTPTQKYDPDHPENNTPYQQYLQTVRAEASDQAAQKGVTDPDLRAEFVKSQMAKAYLGTISHLIDNKQNTAAKGYFDQVKDQLDTATQDKVKGVLQTAATQDDALNLALDVKNTVKGGISAQEKELDNRFKSGKINAQVHDMALQKLRADNAQRRSEEAEYDKNILGQVWDLKNKNPNAALTDLPTGTLAYIQHRGLGPHVDNILASGPATDNPRLFLDLMSQAASDPANFIKQDPTIFRGQLSDAHYRQIEAAYTGINKQDVKAMEANKLVHAALGDTKASLLAAGINLSPKPNTGDAKQLDTFMANLHDQIVAAQQDKGTPLTRDEARSIALGSLKDQALAGTGYFGTTIGQTHMPAWKMAPEQRAADWDIPAQDRSGITQSLRNNGLPVTEANIQRAYKLSKGVHK